MSLSKKRILELFEELNEKLKKQKIIGELYLVGGAVMCLAFSARESTKDLDAFFEPKEKIRKIAEEMSEDLDLPKNWLNDAVKGYLGAQSKFDLFLEKDHLKIFIAHPEYLLAMKCLSFRLGPEFHDENDIRYLLRYLNIETYDQATKIIEKYYPLEKFPQKTLYALEEILTVS
ncbi:MAG: hypothetical protein HYS98_07740 [Deltaproteobacteria bacterium]|nr:hypothetical protein [Deltaproteobacteria bacterium]